MPAGGRQQAATRADTVRRASGALILRVIESAEQARLRHHHRTRVRPEPTPRPLRTRRRSQTTTTPRRRVHRASASDVTVPGRGLPFPPPAKCSTAEMDAVQAGSDTRAAPTPLPHPTHHCVARLPSHGSRSELSNSFLSHRPSLLFSLTARTSLATVTAQGILKGSVRPADGRMTITPRGGSARRLGNGLRLMPMCCTRASRTLIHGDISVFIGSTINSASLHSGPVLGVE